MMAPPSAPPPVPPIDEDAAALRTDTPSGRFWRALTTGRQRRLVRTMSMTELVRGTVQGSREHHGELCRRVQEPLYAYARHLTRDDDEAVDLLQDVYAALPQTLARYHDRGQFMGWLRGVVFNRWRTRARSARHRAEEPLGTTEVATSGRSITTEVAQRDLIDRALRGMPGATRETWMLFAEGLSPQEIADRLEISYGAVNVRLTRARQYLLEHLAHLM